MRVPVGRKCEPSRSAATCRLHRRPASAALEWRLAGSEQIVGDSDGADVPTPDRERQVGFGPVMRVAPAHGFQPRSCNANACGLGSSSIIVRMSAIRKPAVAAIDNRLLAPELAAGIARVKSAKSIGVRTVNRLPAGAGAPERAGHRDHPGAARLRALSGRIHGGGDGRRTARECAGAVGSACDFRPCFGAPCGSRRGGAWLVVPPARRRCSSAASRPAAAGAALHDRAGLMMVARPRPAAQGTRLSAAPRAHRVRRPAGAAGGVPGCADTSEGLCCPFSWNGVSRD